MCLGIPGQIVEINSVDNTLGMVEIGGVRREVNLTCIVDESHPPASCVGEWVLVHVGFAISRIDEEEAKRTIELFAEMTDIQSELQALRQSDTSKDNP
ncbi:MAG: HypC/HybG/HupF family hydrogenase formation chaperone [Nitrospirota bacterium]|nr:MAG: HypC/HybG/HupF family hydrogenase formation chaperone [Nitrospirota bacterium]